VKKASLQSIKEKSPARLAAVQGSIIINDDLFRITRPSAQLSFDQSGQKLAHTPCQDAPGI
jgi:hypothetical protein